jgi:hypothetical protein
MNKFAIEFKWAIRYTIAYLLCVIIEKYSGLYTTHISSYFTYSMLFYVVAFFIFYLAIHDKKKNYFNTIMSWKQGCATGVIMSGIIAVLLIPCLVIAYKGIAPEFFPNMIQHKISSGKVSLQNAENYFNLKNYCYQGIGFTLSLGILFSATASQLLKSK